MVDWLWSQLTNPPIPALLLMGSASFSLFSWLVRWFVCSFLLTKLFLMMHFISLLWLPQGKCGVMVTLILGEEIAVARWGTPTSVGWILLMLKSWGEKNPSIDFSWQQSETLTALVAFIIFPTFQSTPSWHVMHKLQGIELLWQNRTNFLNPKISCLFDCIVHVSCGGLGTS